MPMLENQNQITEPINNQQPIDNLNQDGQQDYIDTINTLRANSVPKDRYDRVLAENKRLLDSLASGEQVEVVAPKKPDIKETLVALGDRENNALSLEWAQQSLAFREAVIVNGGRDPYLPQGPNAQITQEDMISADKMAWVLQHCIDVADGNQAVFANEFNRYHKPETLHANGTRRR